MFSYFYAFQYIITILETMINISSLLIHKKDFHCCFCGECYLQILSQLVYLNLYKVKNTITDNQSKLYCYLCLCLQMQIKEINNLYPSLHFSFSQCFLKNSNTFWKQIYSNFGVKFHLCVICPMYSLCGIL